MNKVASFSAGSMRRLEDVINELAEDYEIINVSLAYNPQSNYRQYNALVLYKQK